VGFLLFCFRRASGSIVGGFVVLVVLVVVLGANLCFVVKFGQPSRANLVLTLQGELAPCRQE